MKICLINNLFEPYEPGGSGAVVKRTAKGLAEAGYGVVVITSKPYFGKPENKYSDYQVIYINSLFFWWRKLPKVFRLIFHIFGFLNIFAAKKISKIVKNEQSDAVFTHNLVGFGFFTAALLNRKFKCIHFLHDAQLLHPSGLVIYGQEKKTNTFLAKIYQKAAMKCFLREKKVVSPSAWLADEHKKRGFFKGAEVLVCPNPMDVKTWDGHGKENNIFTILYVGNMSSEKGADILLDAYSDLRKEERNARLVMAGPAVDKQIAGRALGSEGVLYKGYLDSKEIKRLMFESSVLVIPSVCYENSPTVIYEAAAIGLSVIASGIGGIPELVKKTGGELFEPADAKGLKRMLAEQIKNSRKRGPIQKDNLIGTSSYIGRVMEFNGKNY